MKEKYTEKEIKRILQSKGENYEKIQKKMEETYQMIEVKQKTNQRGKNRILRKTVVWAGGLVAAVAVGVISLGISNPVLAANLPIIGGIFQVVQEKVSYSGNFSEDATQLVVTNQEIQEETNLVQKDQGITVTISEIATDDQCFFFGITMTSEEGFPEDFNRVKNDTEYALVCDTMNCITQGELVDKNGKTLDMSGELSILEGNFTDNHTFQTIGYVDLSCYDEIAEDFTYNFEITDIWSYLGKNYYGNWVYENNPQEGEKHYTGSWKFSVDVNLDKSAVKVIEVNQTNEQGIGIKAVTKGKYYMTADVIVPENQDKGKYITLIYDEEGKRLDSFGDNLEHYSIKDRKTEKVTVYVCTEDDFFMNKTKEQKLKEQAVYQIEVDCNQ